MNYILGTGLSIFGIHMLKLGIEQFANINENTNFYHGGNLLNKKFLYSENKRLNYNFGKYPPCFNLSIEAQQIFDTLDMNGTLDKYRQLFDIYSILLCQKHHSTYKKCNQEMVKERISDIKKMMPEYFDKAKHTTKISKYIKLDNSDISNLILMCFYLIEKHMKKINDEKIINLNHKFYFAVLKELQTLCS